jgi:RNA polymerase sigma-70 factor (ECF subfamily)
MSIERSVNATGQQSVEDLARQARAGSSAAWEQLVRRVQPMVLAHLRRRTTGQDEAEDVCQEALLRAFGGLDGYDAGRPFVPWLLAIAGNVAASRARKRRPCRLADEWAAPADGRPSPAETAAEADRRQMVWETARRLLGRLQYQALWLHYADELSVRDVAGRLGLTRTHVKVLLHRARKRLLTCPELRDQL